jgi:uncharacterized protein YihD (DUF1040 family)
MRRITVSEHIQGDPKFKAYLGKYAKHRGYETKLEDLPRDILVRLIPEAIMGFASLKAMPNEEFELNLVGEIVFKCKKVNDYELLINKDSIVETLELDKNDPMIDVLGNPNNHKRLKPSEEFWHPLAQIEDVEVDGQIEKVLNGYAIASSIIEAIRNPQSTSDNGQNATQFFQRTVLESGKFVNVQVLLENIKAGDLASMMEGSLLINDGFHNIATSQLG